MSNQVEILRPETNLNRWLSAVLCDLIDQNTVASKEMSQEAIKILVNYVEPGLIEQAFGPWLDQYNRLLAKHESTQSNYYQMCLPLDQKESVVQLKTTGE